MGAIVRTIAGRRSGWAVAVLGLVLGGVLIAWGGNAASTAGKDPTSGLPTGAQSTQVVRLQQKLPVAQTEDAVVLYTRDSGLTAQDRRAVESRAHALAALAVGGRVTGPVLSQDGKAALVTLPVSTSDPSGEVAKVRHVAAADLPGALKSGVTGPAAIQADLAAVFNGANTSLLLVTAGVVALLLLVTYRSVLLWMIPLLVIGTADRVATALASKAAAFVSIPLDDATQGILSVLVFGAGTDYALLLISRYRDELRRTDSRFEAMGVALHRTAEAVLSSATTVVLSVLTLLLSLTPTTRGLGLACAVGIVVAATFALVVLPAVLVRFGRWVFWPRRPRVGDPQTADRVGTWSRIGAAVSRRPREVALGAIAGLLVLAYGLSGVTFGLTEADQFTRKPEAISAGQRLAHSFPAGQADPAAILTTPAQADEVAAVAAKVMGVAQTLPGPRSADVAQMDAVLSSDPGSAAARASIVALRKALAPIPDTYVGGTEASALDASASARRDLAVVVPLVLGLVLLVLMILLRALVAPLLLVATVVGTFAASFGLSQLVFHHVFKFAAVDVGVPLITFLFLVALGVDYNIFLVTRAREESRRHGNANGMLRALAVTGGVITSAGILLAAVFAVLGVLPLVTLAQIGTVVCLGVLLDTLLVRTVLVPALALWTGDKFWWPSRGAIPELAQT